MRIMITTHSVTALFPKTDNNKHCGSGQSFVVLQARLHERKKWNGSDKKWNGSDKFLRVNFTWPVPVLPVQFKKGSIDAYGPFSERNG